MNPSDFVKERNALRQAVIKQIKPFFWESGYVKHPCSDKRAPVMLWVPRDSKGNPTDKEYTLKGAFVLERIMGFTDEGVITDMEGHGLVTTYWDGLPIEDLYRLNQWMQRMLPKLTEYDKQQKAKAKVAKKSQQTTNEVALTA